MILRGNVEGGMWRGFVQPTVDGGLMLYIRRKHKDKGALYGLAPSNFFFTLHRTHGTCCKPYVPLTQFPNYN